VASSDFLIAGAGIVGLSLALELDARGASVTVLDAGTALQQTSSAAAGMLAVGDPMNPAALRPLSEFSAALYPAFLDRIAALSDQAIPFQTSTTLESGDHSGALADPRQLVPQLDPGARSFHLLAEHSVDPRQLAPGLLAAVRATRIHLRERTPLERVRTHSTGVEARTPHGVFAASCLIDCMGTWSPAPVRPRKGQMLAVAIPPGIDLTCVLRTPEIYIVPRTEGPNAGRAIVGATIEDVGFDLTVHPIDILTLNAKAVKLLPALADAKFLESWSGLRPATEDGLPILGATATQPSYVLCTGHFRNGILLAPATARVIAQQLTGEAPSVDLTPFAPSRFAASP
jgi:glycine oxidase